MKVYELSTMGEKILIPANNRKEAYARFFLDVKNGKYPLEKIGSLISVIDPDDKEDYPFRTIPTLWLMELISPSMAFLTLEKMLDLDSNTDESAKILVDSAKQDMWILDEIGRLENEAE